MALLLLASSSTRAEDLPKAVVSLNPEWDRVLEKDTVTLTCQGNRMGEDDLTQWWHNGILLPNQTSSSYSIASAKVKDGGEYKCQTNGSQLSDPVQLQVHAAWLLLQAQHWVVQEGDPIVLRCHSWENRVVYKVQYFQNGRGKKFFYQNTEFRIPKATGEHNGSYFCRGMINGVRNESSEAATIIVQAALLPPPGSWTPICLVLGLLFAVDTGLYFSVRRDLQKSMKSRENNRVAWSKNPEDKQEQLRQNSDVGDSEHGKS